MQRHWKIIIGLLFAVAIIFGLTRFENPLNSSTKSIYKQNSISDSLEDYYRASRSLEPQNQTTTVNFLAVGDIMLSRNVAGKIAKAKDPNLPFQKLESLLLSTDFNFGNLESPISGRNDFNPSGNLEFNAPPAYTVGLQKYNFKLLNLANNHAMDQGKAGLDNTRTFLSSLGITTIGTGNNLDEAWQEQIIEKRGIKIGFIGASYSSVNDGGYATNNYVARIEDLENLKSSILNLKSSADFIVVTMHAGTEYTRTPNASQIAFAHSAIDSGADMVIGAHPHWVQTIENYNGRYIFYSLGNFIFDQEWSRETKEGLTLKISLSTKQIGNTTIPGAAMIDDIQGTRTKADLEQIELIPVIIENYSTPRLANETESIVILKKINQTELILK